MFSVTKHNVCEHFYSNNILVRKMSLFFSGLNCGTRRYHRCQNAFPIALLRHHPIVPSCKVSINVFLYIFRKNSVIQLRFVRHFMPRVILPSCCSATITKQTIWIIVRRNVLFTIVKPTSGSKQLNRMHYFRGNTSIASGCEYQ